MEQRKRDAEVFDALGDTDFTACGIVEAVENVVRYDLPLSSLCDNSQGR